MKVRTLSFAESGEKYFVATDIFRADARTSGISCLSEKAYQNYLNQLHRTSTDEAINSRSGMFENLWSGHVTNDPCQDINNSMLLFLFQPYLQR
jgi:hypothetical protein